jgi:hypothetical protein
MAAAPKDDARARYRRGLAISRGGSFVGTMGFVTTVGAANEAVGAVLGALLILLCMGMIHVGGQIQGEASVFLAAWVHGDED